MTFNRNEITITLLEYEQPHNDQPERLLDMTEMKKHFTSETTSYDLLYGTLENMIKFMKIEHPDDLVKEVVLDYIEDKEWFR